MIISLSKSRRRAIPAAKGGVKMLAFIQAGILLLPFVQESGGGV